jgi:hypothetical protein
MLRQTTNRSRRAARQARRDHERRYRQGQYVSPKLSSTCAPTAGRPVGPKANPLVRIASRAAGDREGRW